MRGPMTLAARRVMVAVMMASFLPGCTGWHDRATLAPSPASHRPAFLRVTLQNGHHVELHDAAIVRDSVIGELRRGTARARGAVALKDVSCIADRHFKVGTSAVHTPGSRVRCGDGVGCCGVQ
jgi:hypothetical protein